MDNLLGNILKLAYPIAAFVAGHLFVRWLKHIDRRDKQIAENAAKMAYFAGYIDGRDGRPPSDDAFITSKFRD